MSNGVDWSLLLLLLLSLLAVVVMAVASRRVGSTSEDIEGTEDKEDGAVDRSE